MGKIDRRLATKIAFGLGTTLVVGILAFKAISQPRLNLIAVPQENGYIDLLAAAEVLPTGTIDYTDERSLAVTVEKCSRAYELVEISLGQSCVVPVEVSKSWAEPRHADIALLKKMTSALLARAKLDELNRNPEDAVNHCITAFRFASAVGYGGTLLEYSNAISCRALVLEASRTLIPKLTDAQRSKLATAIADAGELLEQPTVVANRHHEWAQAIYGSERRWYQVQMAVETRSVEPFNLVQKQAEERWKIYTELENSLLNDLGSKEIE